MSAAAGTSAWVRWCVVLVAFVGIVLDAAGAIGALEEPAFGFNTTTVGIAALSRGEFVQLTEIIPGGPMDAAGLRVGDRVRVVRGDLGALDGASENATTAVHFARADGRVVAVRRARLHEYPSAIALALIGIGLAALAIVLALRGWHEAQARWLAIGMAWEPYAWIPTIDPIAPITALQNYGPFPIMGVGTLALVAFATGWLATPAALARVLRWAAAGFAIVFTGATIAAIRTLAAEVDAVSTAEAIAPFVVDQLRAVAGIATAVYVEDDDGFVRAAGTIGSEPSAADTPSVVALRASLAPVRIDAGNGLGGAMIFPLAVRGRLRGGLACAYPAGDDDFAPDEAAALAALASRIAIARDDLMAQSLHAKTVRLVAERDGLTERLVALERENALLTRLAGRS